MPTDVKPPQGRFGVALVEIALVLPLVLAIVGGVVEFGRAISLQQTVEDAARFGARLAARPGADESATRTAISSYLVENAGVESGRAELTITVEPAAGHPAADTLKASRPKDLVRVTIRLPYREAGWWAGRFVEGVTLTASHECRRESPAESPL